MDDREFSWGVEAAIDPQAVLSAGYHARSAVRLPVGIRRRLVQGASAAATPMSFVVEPYSLFAVFDVVDFDRARALLPANWVLSKSAVLAGDPPGYRGILSVFRVRTSFFAGIRVELYLIGQNVMSGRFGWAMIDCSSDAISYDPNHGLRAPTTRAAVHTTTFAQRVFADVSSTDGLRSLTFDAMLDNARPRTLDRQLWVLGNLTVGYGTPLSAQPSPEFSLLFLPGEMSKALSVAPVDALVRAQGWYQGLLAPQASLVLCFPFAQHFLCDAPGMHSSYQGLQSLAAVEHAEDYGILQAELAARANHPL